MTRAAILQTTTGIDPVASAADIADAVGRAAAGGAAMLFTPEMSNLLDRDRARAAAALTDEEGDRVLATTCEAAARTGIWVHLGSLAVRRPGGQLANRGFVIDGTGAVRARYDKMHLFDVDLPNGESWRESASYVRGEAAVAADTPMGRLGLTVCYDLRFPALFAALSGVGATILSVPAAFTRPTGAMHWHLLLRARAVENACFVIAAAQTGIHADGRETFGHSLVVDPLGEVLLDARDAPGLYFAEVDPARVEAARARIPVLAHRRTVPSVEVAA